MRFRTLRIAWSVAWGLAAVLLIALWVRSYWWMDVVYCPRSEPLLINSANGIFQVNVMPNNIGTGWGPGWGWMSLDTEGERRNLASRPSWSWTSDQFVTVANFPAWSVVMLLALAAVPWIPWRFSLRTLLIATTLVAVVLGLMVYAGL